MARETMRSLLTVAGSAVLSLCTFVFVCATADAQRPNRQECATRYENGRPYIFCKENRKALKPASPRPEVQRQPPRPRVLERSITVTPHRPGLERQAPRPQVIERSITAAPRRQELQRQPDRPQVIERSITAAPSRPGPERQAPQPRVIERSIAVTPGVMEPREAAPKGGREGADTFRAGRPPAARPLPQGQSAPLQAIRALIEPSEIPARDVAGYGVVAFTTRPIEQDATRNGYICEAYKATLMTQSELPGNAPMSQEMITYWPVVRKDTPEAQRGDCKYLVENYALRFGLDAIRDADKRQEALASRRGPFLIAWAPSQSRFEPDALVLVMDLSTFDSERSFVEVFQDWRQKIVDNPQLWRRGFDIEIVRGTIRDTFDRYGDGLMRLIKAGS